MKPRRPRAKDASDPPAAFGLTALSDVSANIFAAFLLMWFAMIAEGTATSLRVESDVVASQRALAPPDRVLRLLYDRLTAPQGVSLDIGPQRVAVVRGDETQWIDAANTQALARMAAAAPREELRVFVIAHAAYPATIGALTGAQRHWKEISVPDALCASDRRDWSPEFLALKESAVDFQSFKRGLARLLTTKRGRDQAQRTWDDYAAARASEATPVYAFDGAVRLWRALPLLIGFAAVLACLCFIVHVETRSPPE
jgi:hypothetical protein